MFRSVLSKKRLTPNSTKRVNRPFRVAVPLLLALTTPAVLAWHGPMSLESITTDINQLASDQMNGRKTFSPEIDQAANYIASRFQQAGLQPFSGKSFLQSFALKKVETTHVTASLDKKPLDSQHLFAMAAGDFRWTEKDDLRIETIKANDNFRKRLFAINQLTENVLILVDPKHSAAFSQARNFFSRGRLLKDDQPKVSALAVLTDVQSPKRFQINVKTKTKELPLANVVGVLKANQPAGADHNRQSIIFSAHYDHLGGSPSAGKDTIFNGADDDASGTTAVIQLAEHYARVKNRQRDILFVAFTAEEMGGYGSQYFSTHIDPEQVAAMINIEMIGKPSKFGPGQVWMTGYELSNLGKLLNQALSGKGFKIHPDPYPKYRLFYRSDNATLARLGVPAHSFSSTQIDQDQHYHKVSDEVKTLDLESMQTVIRSLAVATEPLVAGSITPSRIKPLPASPSGTFF